MLVCTARPAVPERIEGMRGGQTENGVFAAFEAICNAIMARQAIYTRKEVTWTDVQRM